MTSLQDTAGKLSKWFSDNQMMGNTDKCHLLLTKDKSSEIHIGDSIIESSTCEKLLGIKIDSKLLFDDHIQDLCNKANRKLRALARATPYMNRQKRKVLINAFYNAPFNYCPLIWMLHVVRITIKLNIYMKDICVLFIMINSLLMKDF